MKKFYQHLSLSGLFALAIAGTAVQQALAADGTPAGKETKVVAEQTYGSLLYPSDQLSYETLCFYDSQNRLLRKVSYNAGSLEKVYHYEYNTQGQLALTFSQLYNINASNIGTFQAAVDSMTYEYDAAGNLLRQMGKSEGTAYTYDAEGNVVKKEVYAPDYMNLGGALGVVSTFVYSDFIAKNCPTHVSSSDIYNSDVYEGTLTYDDGFNLLCETDSMTDADGNKWLKKATYNHYNADGSLQSTVHYTGVAKWDADYMNIEAYIATPQDSTAYSYIDDNHHRLKYENFTWDAWNEPAQWMGSSTYTVTDSREIDGAVAPTITVEAVEGKMNTNKITIHFPQANLQKYYTYQVFRDGFNLGRVDNKTLDVANCTFTYTDEGVTNGTHEYFAQTVQANGTDDNIRYNISDIVTVSNHTDLPAPTNLHGTHKEITDDNSYMYIAWDAPAYTDEMGFQRYNVMEVDQWGMGDNMKNIEGNGTDTSFALECFGFYTEMTVYVQAQYALGTANSDTITVKMDELNTAVGTVETEIGTIEYANHTVSVSTPAHIAAIALNGKKVAEVENATSLSLENEAKGTYVITVVANGKANVLKVVR